MGERRVRNAKVGGSIPLGSTMIGEDKIVATHCFAPFIPRRDIDVGTPPPASPACEFRLTAPHFVAVCFQPAMDWLANPCVREYPQEVLRIELIANFFTAIIQGPLKPCDRVFATLHMGVVA